jgi:hypothetical protein
LRKFREAAGATPQGIATTVGISVPDYYDLETDEDELYMCIPLAKLRAITRHLGVHARELFVEDSSGSQAPINFDSLAEKAKQQLRTNEVTVSDFEDKVGWQLVDSLADPQAAWGWNVDCLRDVCGALELNWLDALPE